MSSSTARSKDERMLDLLLSFPSLPQPQNRPWDAMVFLEWLCTGGWSHGQKCAARFLLSVWNPSTDWVDLARGLAFPFPDAAQAFDLHEALAIWDDGHRAAFAAWVADPWWP